MKKKFVSQVIRPFLCLIVNFLINDTPFETTDLNPLDIPHVQIMMIGGINIGRKIPDLKLGCKQNIKIFKKKFSQIMLSNTKRNVRVRLNCNFEMSFKIAF